MFIWEFLIDVVLGQFIDWVYAQVVAFLGDFFELMGGMGAELFDMQWVQAITTFLSYFAWALYVVGLVVAGFEYAIEAQNERGSIKDVGINAIKGFMAVGLFTTVPVEPYKYCIDLQGSFSQGLTSLWQTGGSLSTMAVGALTSPMFAGFSPMVALFVIILMGYAVTKTVTAATAK